VNEGGDRMSIMRWPLYGTEWSKDRRRTIVNVAWGEWMSLQRMRDTRLRENCFWRVKVTRLELPVGTVDPRSFVP